MLIQQQTASHLLDKVAISMIYVESYLHDIYDLMSVKKTAMVLWNARLSASAKGREQHDKGHERDGI